MPAPLPSAPWLQPPDTTGNFMRGASLGQQAGEAQARLGQAAAALQAQTAHANAQLKQQSDRTAMEFEVRKQEHERETLMAQQKMEIENQYRQAQIGIAKQKSDEAAKMNSMKLQQFAKKAAVEMQINERIKNGEDPSKVYMELGIQLTGSMTGYGAAITANAKANAPAPQTTWNPPANGAPGYITDPRGVPHFVPKQSAPIVDPTKHALLASYTSALTKALDEQNLAESGGKKKEIESADRLVQLRRSQIAELSGTNAPSGSGAVAHYDPASKKLVFAKGAQTSVSPSDKQQATLPQSQPKAQEQETPVNFDQYKKAIMSLPLDKRGVASYKAFEKIVSELVKAAGIPKEWDRLRIGSSIFHHDTEGTLFNALLKGDSHGITAKDVQGIFDAQSPETQAQILGKALKAAGVSAPSGDASESGGAQAPLPQGAAQSPYE